MSGLPACAHPAPSLWSGERINAAGEPVYWVTCLACGKFIAGDLTPAEFRRLAAFKLTGVPGVEGLDFPTIPVTPPPASRHAAPCPTCGGYRSSRRVTCRHCGHPGLRRHRAPRLKLGGRDRLDLVAADLRVAINRYRVFILPGADDRLEAEHLADWLPRLVDRLDLLLGTPQGHRLQSPRRVALPRAPRRDQSGD